MTKFYHIDRKVALVDGNAVDMFRVGFGEPAQNPEIVRAAEARMSELAEAGEFGGELALVNGPASLPVAMAVIHRLAHMYQAVAWYDPKIKGYVVGITHGGPHPLGVVIPSDKDGNPL